MKKLFSGQQSHYIGRVFQVGNYSVTIEELLAEGGFSLVFLVRCNRTGEKYALKRLSVNNTQDLRNCQKEIRISKELSKHKNVITLLSSAINHLKDDVIEILLLMECCRVHVLQLMNQNIDHGFTEPQVLKIFCDMCEAVSVMHHFNPPLTHRDLKVENILYRTQTNDYLLCDFGSAAVGTIQTANHSNIPQLEEDIKRNTTLAYRAPEMIDLYSEKPISTKADVWALGCMLYKLCFYSLPFGENILAMQNGHFSIPSTSKFSVNLHKLIRFMLIVDPALRPDIFQVSYVAFKLAGLPCPVKNVNNVSSPDHLPDAEDYNEFLRRSLGSKDTSVKSKTSARVQQTNLNSASVATGTSITVRERPRPLTPVGVRKHGKPQVTEPAVPNIGSNLPHGQPGQQNFQTSAPQGHHQPRDGSGQQQQVPSVHASQQVQPRVAAQPSQGYVQQPVQQSSQQSQNPPNMQQINQPGYQDPRYMQNAYYQPAQRSHPQQQQNYANQQQLAQGSQIQQRVQPPPQVPQVQSSAQQPTQGTQVPQQYQQQLTHGSQIHSQYVNQQSAQGSHLPQQAQQHHYPNPQQPAHALQTQQPVQQQPIQGSQVQQQQSMQGPPFQQQYVNQQPPEPQLQQQMPQQQQHPSQGSQVQQQADVNLNTQQPQLMDEFRFDNIVSTQVHQQTQNSRYVNQQMHYPQSAAIHQNSTQPPAQYYPQHQQPAPTQDNQQIKANLQIPEHLRQHRRQVSDPNQISNLVPATSTNTPNRIVTRARPASSTATFASAPVSPRSSPPNVRRSVQNSQSLNVTLNQVSHKINSLSQQGDAQNSQNRDLFGAAPFGSTSSSGTQAKDTSIPQQVVATDVQKDLFGAAPFSAESHGEVVSEDNNQPKNTTDLFGAKPFAVDNSVENNPPVDTVDQKRISLHRQESDVFDAIPFGDEIDEFSSLSQSRLQNSSNPGSRPTSLVVDESDAFGSIPFGDNINKDVSEKLHLFSLSSSRSNSSIASNSSAEV